MDCTFTYTLTEAEKKSVLDFYHSLDRVTLEQFPGWEDVVHEGNRTCYFVARDQDTVVCYSRIAEGRRRPFRTASISFGPLFRDPDVLILAIKEIHRHFRRQGFCCLSVQLAIPTGPVADYIEYNLNRELKIRYRFDRHNWSSLVVDLSPPAESLLRSFSKGHKSAITKSIRDGVTVRQAETLDEIMAVCNIYTKMNQARKVHDDANADRMLFQSLFNFIREQNCGVVLVVRDKEGTVVGGVIALFQGDTVRYYKGASDPDRRDIAILHPAIFEAMKIGKERGLRFFDLWGYNHFVTEDDQVFHINKFKKGFTHEFIFYPKIMHFELRPFLLAIHGTLAAIRRRFRN